jgi:hypothetical protein
MKIKTSLVKRDPTGAILSESLIAKHAIVTDEEAGTSEVLTSDTVEIEGFTFLRTDGVFQVQLGLGGHDAKGVFHRDLRYQPALVSIVKSRPNDAKFWALHDLDNLKVLDLEQVKAWIFDVANTVDVVAQAVWNLPELESRLHDDTGKLVGDYKRGSRRATGNPIAPTLENTLKR